MPTARAETPQAAEPQGTILQEKTRGSYEAWVVAAVVVLVYAARLGNVPIVKVDDFWGANASAAIAQTGSFALPAFAGHLQEAQKTFFHPPAFYILQAPWIRLLGVSPVSVRLLPTLSALLSLAFLYGVLLHLTKGRKHSRRLSLLGVGLVAFNPLTFALARHARPDTTVMLLATATVYLLRRSLFDPKPAEPEGRVTPLAAGLLSGLAFACHYWSWFLPGTVGLVLASRRRWRALAWYSLGYSVFVAAVAAWLLANWSAFLEETRWLRSHAVTPNAGGYLRLRLAGAADNWFSLRTVGTWLVIALGTGLALLGGLRKGAADRTAPRSWFLIGGALFGFLLLFPRQSSYYIVCPLYYWGAIVPLAFSRLLEEGKSAPARAWKRRGALAAGVAVLAIELAGIGYLFKRDRHAEYEATFRPFAEAMDAADPTQTQTIVGPALSYLALAERPFLVDWNPSLWKVAATPDLSKNAGRVLTTWRARGVRFVLLGTLDGPDHYPAPTGLSPLRRAVLKRIEARGRTVVSRSTRFYVGRLVAYRRGRLTLYDIGAGG